MGIGKRILDIAKANLNALLDRAAGDTPLGELSDKELELELERRKSRRVREEQERRARELAEEAARKRGNVPPSARKANGATNGRSKLRASSADDAKKLRQLYEQLEVPYGAPLDEIKKSFRRLMRKYHPDLHINDAKKHAAATQLTMTLTEAYRELERRLS
jgi:hypothetical protein